MYYICVTKIVKQRMSKRIGIKNNDNNFVEVL